MKLTIQTKDVRTAMATTEDGRQIWFATTNTSWYDWAMETRKVGDTFEVPDSSIRVSDKGRPYIDRLGVEAAMKEMQFKTAFLKQQILMKQLSKMEEL